LEHLEFSFSLYSCLPFKTQRAGWLDTKTTKPMEIPPSTRIHLVISTTTPYKLAEIIRDTWPQINFNKEKEQCLMKKQKELMDGQQ